MTRPLLALLVVLLVLGPAAIWLPQQMDDWTGETDPRFQAVGLLSALSAPPIQTEDEALFPIEVAPFGVNVFLEQEVEEWKLRKTFDLLKAAGVRWIRQQIPWKDIEIYAKGDFSSEYGETWAKYDRFIGLANEYGIRILARLDAPPNWSREDNRLHFRPPDNFDDYGDFVETFVRRYRGQVQFFQIWNEPNIFPEWGWQPVDAGGYATLLRIASTRAKAANPDAVIVAAALAPTVGTEDGYNENDLVYLQKLYDAGAGPYFDVMSAMGYSPWTGPGDRRTDPGRVNFSRVALIRDVMVRNGDATKPVWIAEVGWNSLPEAAPLPPTHGRVSRERQARYTIDAYRRALDEWPWVGVVFLWHLRMVHDENRDQVMYYFGLADADFTLHPHYFAYQSIAARPLALYPGRKSASHPAIGTAGEWAYDRGGGAESWYLRSTTAGDALAFTFQGSEVQLALRRGPGAGRVRVLVDGAPAAGWPDGRIDLAAPATDWGPVTVAADLPPGEHRVDLVVEAGSVAFDGVTVRGAARPVGQATVAAGIAAVLALWIVWLAGGAALAAARSWRPSRPANPLPAIGRRLRRRWVAVRLPAELYAEIARDLPKDRRAAFVAAAVVEALRRRRAPAPAEPAEDAAPEPVAAGERGPS